MAEDFFDDVERESEDCRVEGVQGDRICWSKVSRHGLGAALEKRVEKLTVFFLRRDGGLIFCFTGGKLDLSGDGLSQRRFDCCHVEGRYHGLF